jgi:hypothetical protein
MRQLLLHLCIASTRNTSSQAPEFAFSAAGVVGESKMLLECVTRIWELGPCDNICDGRIVMEVTVKKLWLPVLYKHMSTSTLQYPMFIPIFMELCLSSWLTISTERSISWENDSLSGAQEMRRLFYGIWRSLNINHKNSPLDSILRS